MSSSDISSLSKGQKNSLAVSYAVLILSDSGKDISSENLSSVIKSAKLEVWGILNADRQWIPLDLRVRAQRARREQILLLRRIRQLHRPIGTRHHCSQEHSGTRQESWGQGRTQSRGGRYGYGRTFRLRSILEITIFISTKIKRIGIYTGFHCPKFYNVFRFFYKNIYY